MEILLNFAWTSSPSSALAASGGQLPLSSLEGGNKVMLGTTGGQGGGLPSSLFLNHPAFLNMGQNPGAGLISSAVAKASQPSPFPSASSISPTPCSPSPCSSPASSCSSSEMAHSPPPLGGAKIEWPRHGPIKRGGGMRKREPRLSHQSYLFLSLVLFFRYFFLPQRPSLSPSLQIFRCQKYTEWKRREGGKEVKEGRRGEGKRKIQTKNLYLSKQMGRGQRGTFLSITGDVRTAPLRFPSLWRKTNQWLSNDETEPTAEERVEAHKPKITKR